MVDPLVSVPPAMERKQCFVEEPVGSVVNILPIRHDALAFPVRIAENNMEEGGAHMVDGYPALTTPRRDIPDTQSRRPQRQRLVVAWRLVVDTVFVAVVVYGTDPPPLRWEILRIVVMDIIVRTSIALLAAAVVVVVVGVVMLRTDTSIPVVVGTEGSVAVGEVIVAVVVVVVAVVVMYVKLYPNIVGVAGAMMYY